MGWLCLELGGCRCQLEIAVMMMMMMMIIIAPVVKRIRHHRGAHRLQLWSRHTSCSGLISTCQTDRHHRWLAVLRIQDTIILLVVICGICNDQFIAQSLYWVCLWKNFENRSVFGEDVAHNFAKYWPIFTFFHQLNVPYAYFVPFARYSEILAEKIANIAHSYVTPPKRGSLELGSKFWVFLQMWKLLHVGDVYAPKRGGARH